MEDWKCQKKIVSNQQNFSLLFIYLFILFYLIIYIYIYIYIYLYLKYIFIE